MNKEQLINTARAHMKVLCADIAERRVGSKGNRQATDYVKQCFGNAGWSHEETELAVVDWKTDGATLTCGSHSFEVHSSHYSLGCSVEAGLLAIDTLEKLEQADLADRIILLYGEIAARQITPKGFIFYQVDEHDRIIDLLEKGQPKAIVTATQRDSLTAGGIYPFPMFEDGNFNIPSVYMKDTEGLKLLACAGRKVKLESLAVRIPETAYNIIARKGTDPTKRVVISAHVDAKIGTPGAMDNATGVTVLMLLAQLMKDYNGPYTLELAALNGEDYYAVPGQAKYLEQNRDRFAEVVVNINIDGAGYFQGPSGFTDFGLPGNIRRALDKVIAGNENIVEGLPWYQSDHSMFIQQGRPAIAVSSQHFIENFATQDITHTPKDNLTIISYERVAECAAGIQELIGNL